ncbi:MAG: HDOD domain-containing protein [Phycisphaerae bacterium]
MPDAILTAENNPVVDAAISRIGEIATLPEVTVKIIEVVEDPDASARDLHEIIRNDPALSAKLLKVVNSAFYGLPGQVSSIDRAIVLLGLSAIKNIAIAMSMTHMFRSGKQVKSVDGLEIWRHSLAVGTACRILAKLQGRPTYEEVFLTGLLHDMGLIVERQAFPDKLAEVVHRYEASPQPFCQIEMEVIGADHQAFGQALAAKWRFPRVLRTAIGYHHKPEELAPENRELAAIVHVADVLACRAKIGFTMTVEGEDFGDEILDAIRLTRDQVDSIGEEFSEHIAETESLFSS